ncbi:HK97-gp10 family putative phage morphogenesis protein [Anatilimnocola floriformis]|uniref:HK97-gp10 family putative phage morphogenesis protein n=1 Tax=Anatilimnocola floriformis TaxID=2948575 RepID=UPI0020C4823A|nr:HK97-gp10 family putative phage morphogenesis protein [Anatilimnocola floriformis]
MNGVTVSWKKLEKELKQFDKKVQKKTLMRNMRKGMKIIKAEVEEQAPVGETGALADSVKIKAGRKSRTSASIKVQIGEGDFKGETWYAAAVEYGTSKMEANPFMRRSLDNKGDEAKNVAMTGIAIDIEKLAAVDK